MSIVTAPWRLKTWVIVEKIRSLMTMSLPSPATCQLTIDEILDQCSAHNPSSPWEFSIGIEPYLSSFLCLLSSHMLYCGGKIDDKSVMQVA